MARWDGGTCLRRGDSDSISGSLRIISGFPADSWPALYGAGRPFTCRTYGQRLEVASGHWPGPVGCGSVPQLTFSCAAFGTYLFEEAKQCNVGR